MKRLLLILLLVGCGSNSSAPDKNGTGDKLSAIKFEAGEIAKDFPAAEPRTKVIIENVDDIKLDFKAINERLNTLENKPNWIETHAPKICFGLGLAIILIGIYAPGHAHSTAGLFLGSVGFASGYYGKEVAIVSAIGLTLYQVAQLWMVWDARKKRKVKL